MANLNVRINNKFDTYENWMKSTLVLGAGEIAVATIPSGDDTGLTPPAVGVKIGDGEKTFSQLSWIQATAGDVYGWAKAATKPEYKASEITGLSEYISGEIQDTDTQYQLVKVDDYNYKLQSKTLGGEWIDVEGSAIVIPAYDDTALAGRVTANEQAIAGIKDSTVYDSFKDVETAVSGIDTRVIAIEGDYLKAADKTELEGKITTAQTGVDNIAKDYLKAADKTELEGKITAVQNTIGTVTEGKTVVEMIADAQTAATYDDTALAGRVAANEGAIEVLDGKVTTLIGDDADKSVRTIANEELAKQLIAEGAAESLDTLQEIAAWIQSHPGDASAMNEAIVALQAKVTLGTDAEGKEYATVKAYVEAAIAALNVGQYALAADLTELAGRVTATEGAIETLDTSLAAIAKTGNVNDLVQTEGDVMIFNCGTSAV